MRRECTYAPRYSEFWSVHVSQDTLVDRPNRIGETFTPIVAMCFVRKRSTSRNRRGTCPRSRNPIDTRNVLNVRYSAIHKDTTFVRACHCNRSNSCYMVPDPAIVERRLIENKKMVIFSMDLIGPHSSSFNPWPIRFILSETASGIAMVIIDFVIRCL